MSSESNAAPGLLLSSDLMFGSQFAVAARALNLPLVTAASATAALARLPAGGFCCVLIDLTTQPLNVEEVVKAARVAQVKSIVAFGPHVQEALLQQARDQGCDEVLTRGQVSGGLPRLLPHWFGVV